MATINFEDRGKRGGNGGKSGPPSSQSVNSAGISGWNFDRVVTVTPALAATLKVPPGSYEHTGEDSSGNWIYSPCTRNV